MWVSLLDLCVAMASCPGQGGQAEEGWSLSDMVRRVFSSQEENFFPANLASEAIARPPFFDGKRRAQNNNIEMEVIADGDGSEPTKEHSHDVIPYGCLDWHHVMISQNMSLEIL